MKKIMKKRMILLENIFKKINSCSVYLIIIFSFNFQIGNANETWILDKDLSSINFEVPVLFLENVKGNFKKIDGFIVTDSNKQKNYKAVFSVDIESIELNYNKYKNLIFSDIFFDIKNYPKAVLDTKKFSYTIERRLEINAELTIKNIGKDIPIKILAKKLTEDLIQIKTDFEIYRNDFNIGELNWSNTSILKDKVKINSNLFLFKE